MLQAEARCQGPAVRVLTSIESRHNSFDKLQLICHKQKLGTKGLPFGNSHPVKVVTKALKGCRRGVASRSSVPRVCCSSSIRFKVGARASRGCCQAVATRSSVPRVCCSYSLRLQVVTKALRGCCQAVTSRSSVPRVCCSYSLRLQVGQGLPFGYSHRLQVFKRPLRGCRQAVASRSLVPRACRSGTHIERKSSQDL